MQRLRCQAGRGVGTEGRHGKAGGRHRTEMSADMIAAIVDEGLGNSSYLVDLGDRRALVVDPERDPAPYLAAAAKRGLRLAYVAETHLHADFVSGSRELAAHGAKVLAAAAGRTAFPHRGLDDGTELDLGGLTLRALATPGHTPEHLSYLLLDGRQPLALFSGGSLLVGAVARTVLSGVKRRPPRPAAQCIPAMARRLRASVPRPAPGGRVPAPSPPAAAAAAGWAAVAGAAAVRQAVPWSPRPPVQPPARTAPGYGWWPTAPR